MPEIKLQKRYPDSKLEDIAEATATGYCKGFNDARNKYAGEWISVKDDKPSPFKDVLVWFSYYSFKKEKRVEYYGIGEYLGLEQENKHPDCAWIMNDLNTGKEKILFWMYLPEKPKKGKK